MKGVAQTRAGILASAALFAALFFLFLAPQHASAATLSVQTKQVIPPGAACAPLTASGFTTSVSNGAIQSFTITINNSSYVAVLGSVGNTGIPFYAMRRFVDASGNLQMQVTVPSVPFVGTLPISLTYLEANGAGQPVCLAVVSTTITGASPANVSIPPVQSTPSTSPSIPSLPTTGTNGSGSQQTGSTSSATTGSSTVVIPGAGSALQNLCYAGGATRLWYVLLAIFALLAAIIALAEFPIDWPQNVTWRSGAIIVLLLILLVFWYFSPSCRPTSAWPAVIAVLIALAGIVGAYQSQPASVRIWLLGEKNK